MITCISCPIAETKLMFWQDDDDKTPPQTAADEVVDLSFAISCKQLPLDHAWKLSHAVRQALPWFDEDASSGVHTIHVADSGNGWQRPEDDDALLIPSKRTRLELRLPKHRVEAARALTGQTLAWEDYRLSIGSAKVKHLSPAADMFARHVLSDATETEPQFLQRMADSLWVVAQFRVKKMLCGKSHTLNTPEGALMTRYLMLAELDPVTSLSLQQQGLGTGRKLGCGLLLPHKSIKTLKPTD